MAANTYLTPEERTLLESVRVKHCEEIAIGCLVGKSHTRVACTLEQLSCLFIELKRERSCVELHASCAQQWTF